MWRKVSGLRIKERKRYILIKIHGHDHNITREDLWHSVKDELRGLMGILGILGMGFRLIRYSQSKGVALFACNHDKLLEALACLTFVTEIRGRRISLDVLRVSGTIKGAYRVGR